MGLNSSMFSGLSGLSANSQMLTVAGNNISNVNTNAFKRSRINFETQISQTLRNASAPTSELGGTNPAQVGLGTRLGAVSHDFSDGGLKPTGVSTDMAVQGEGFFAVKTDAGTRYTRDGSFTLDRDHNLVTSGGGVVQGFGVDDNFNVVEGALTDVNIPLGQLTLAKPTTSVNFSGNLNAGGDVAVNGSLINSQTLYSDPVAATTAGDATALNSLYDASGNQLLNTGDVITLTGATRGGATLPDQTFEVNNTNTTGSDDHGTTAGDLEQFLNDTFGIDESVSGGVSMNSGVLSIEGNAGAANGLGLSGANFVVNQSTSPATPISFNKARDADGESTRTTFATYDSLGNQSSVDLSVVLQSKDNNGTTWRYYAHSADDTDVDTEVGTGLLNFDNAGKLVSVTDGSIQLDHAASGAQSPQSVDLSLKDKLGSISALADAQSQISATSQDGSPIGTLEDFNVGADGAITGVFSNNLSQTLGRIPLAVFTNNEGLAEAGENLYRPTVNSGLASMGTPTTGGAGKIVGRSLEQSNVELSNEFVNLISATTGFSASSRVVSTSDRMIQDLLHVIP